MTCSHEYSLCYSESMSRFLARFILTTCILLLFASKAHAATYYLSPSGSDTNTGSASSPWKTINKANASVTAGDTVIFKDGTYSGYQTINKSNTIWRAQNKRQAIIDGGFAPSLLQGAWENVENALDTACAQKDKWSVLLVVGGNNVEVDGLFLRNSCGRGLLIGNSAQNITIKNNQIDWTFTAGLYADGESNNLQFIGNDFTRISFNDIPPTILDPEDYNVNTSVHMSGEDMLFRDNLFAWGRGEIAMNGARNMLFENNTVIGNKNNFYNGWADGVIVRNNLFWSPESKNNPNTHWHKFTGNDNDWHISSRNENDDRWLVYASGLNNVAYYNNLIINNRFSFEGYHKNFSSNTTQLYFGHNTLIAGPNSGFLFDLSFKAKGESDSMITGVVENNIFDVSKDPAVKVKAQLSSNDQITFRNNLLPSSATVAVKGQGDVYSNTPGLVNALTQLNYPIPAIGAASVDVQALRSAVNINNYFLTSSSLAINAGTTAGAVNNTQIPPLARTQDYIPNNRLGIPDLGAFEFTGTVNPSPTSGTSSAGDLTGDGLVNLQDHAQVVSMFKNPYTLLDYNAVISNYD